MILYCSVTAGIPIFLVNTRNKICDMLMGKKAYLFCRELDACKRAAMMYSLFGACKVMNINPEQ